MLENKYKIDEYDYKLLSVLEQDASIPLSQIAKKINKSREFCDFRLKKLKEHNVISNIQAIINPKKLGFLTYNFLFELQEITNSKQIEFENFLINSKHTKYVSQTSGSWEYQVSVLVKSLEDLNEFLDSLNQDFGRYIKNNNFHLRTKTLYVGSFMRVLGKKEFIEFEKEKKYIKQKEYELDDLDYNILELYSQDATLSTKDLATKLNTTFDKIRYRLKLLKDNQIITYTKITINSAFFGYHNYSIALKLKDLTLDKEKKLKKFLTINKKVFFAIKTIGNWDLRIEVMGKSQKDLKEFISELREEFGENLIYYNFSLQLDHLKKVSFVRS